MVRLMDRLSATLMLSWPRIADTLQQLEGFQMVTALDVNTIVGYYTIELTPGAKYFTTIVTEFAKFGYNVLPQCECVVLDMYSKIRFIISWEILEVSSAATSTTFPVC